MKETEVELVVNSTVWNMYLDRNFLSTQASCFVLRVLFCVYYEAGTGNQWQWETENRSAVGT